MPIKIDFHVHTLADQIKDNGFEFSMSWLKGYVEKDNLDAIAITNHNLFCKDQFLTIQQNLKCVVYPGMELSLQSGHVNLVFDVTRTNIDELQKISDSLSLGKTGGLELEEFISLFSPLSEGLMIFEDGKSNSLPIGKEFEAPEFSKYTFVRGVNSQIKFNKVKLQAGKYCPALFSDAHTTEDDPDSDRNNIEKLSLKNTYLQMEDVDFKQILAELKVPDHVKVTSDGFPDTFEVRVDSHPVTVSTKLNLVVGRRGSGKTYLLDHIRKQYGEGSLEYIRQFESTTETQKFLGSVSQGIAEKSHSRWVQDNLISLQSVVELYQKPFQEKMDEYIQSVHRFSTQIVNSNLANQVVLFKAQALPITDLSQQQNLLKQFKQIINSPNLWRYASNENRKKHLENLAEAYAELRNNLWKEAKASKLKVVTNAVITTVKDIVEKSTAVFHPINIDFTEQYRHRIEKKAAIHFVRLALNDEVDECVPKYTFKIHVVKSKWTNAEEFRQFAPNGNKVAVQNNLIKPYLKGDIEKFLDHLFSSTYHDSLPINRGDDLARYLFNFKVELLNESNTPASGGQQIALGLMMKLDEAKRSDIVLVDEPEASLDNVFIKHDLIPKLRELSETSSVFVITHNSTLGALLNPDRLIIAKYDTSTNKHSLMTGDFHARKVRDDTGAELPSYDDFVDAMEAGIVTYREKGEEYESLRN